jgi:hypothetical protein
VNLETMIENGCQTFYQVNDGSGCATPTDPLSCIPRPTTGAKAGQIRQGLNARLTPNGVSDCTSNALNRWASTNGNPPDGDPRIVKLFVAPVGSFGTNSNPGPVPVDGYASFYIAGWDGDPCSGDPPAPAEGIVGYFMTKVEDNGAGGGTKPCNPDSVLTCVAVLTK